MKNKKYKVPEVLVDTKEKELIEVLTNQYEKMIAPGKIKTGMKNVGSKINKAVPQSVKDFGTNTRNKINEQEVMKKSLEILAKDFQAVQEFAAKYTISQDSVCQAVNKISDNNKIESLDELCLLRAYDIQKIVEKYKLVDVGAALTQGAGFGAIGFAGIPFNLMVSTFLFFRAVQAVALFYGYDVKNNPEELEIAGEVFSNSMNLGSCNNGLAQDIAKVMLITETTVVKQTAAKGWEAMVNKDAVTLLIAQIRALANKSAQKAIEKAGKSNLEKNIFTKVFEQIGKKLTQKSLVKVIPYWVGAIIGGTIDSSQMINVIKYANIFYCKRFILEKEKNINILLEQSSAENKDSGGM